MNYAQEANTEAALAGKELDRAYRESVPEYRRHEVAVAQVHAQLSTTYAMLALVEVERSRA